MLTLDFHPVEIRRHADFADERYSRRHPVAVLVDRRRSRRCALAPDAEYIARRLDTPPNTLSANLNILSHAGLVRSRRFER